MSMARRIGDRKDRAPLRASGPPRPPPSRLTAPRPWGAFCHSSNMLARDAISRTSLERMAASLHLLAQKCCSRALARLIASTTLRGGSGPPSCSVRCPRRPSRSARTISSVASRRTSFVPAAEGAAAGGAEPERLSAAQACSARLSPPPGPESLALLPLVCAELPASAWRPSRKLSRATFAGGASVSMSSRKAVTSRRSASLRRSRV
mmetsp:Transcript_43782/g.136962  ORF Transcript_43782/g.136962 Transcript_43782/m.136962 type:complete len:207 (+) Transcript_43782:66-686(+)